MKKVSTKLILKKNIETGEYLYFIATMGGRNEDKNAKEINYTNNRSFTGSIFISDLNGFCVAIYHCHSDVRQRMELLDPTTNSTQDNEALEGTVVQMFATPAAAYSFGETGGGEIGGGGGGIVMDRCSICNNPKTNILCLYCNGTYVKPNCKKCSGSANNCYCCFFCKITLVLVIIPLITVRIVAAIFAMVSVVMLVTIAGVEIVVVRVIPRVAVAMVTTNHPVPCIYCHQTNCSGDCRGCNHEICPGCNKYIILKARSSVCNSHKYCSTNGKCVEITLNVSETEVTISDLYTIIAEISTINLSNISNVFIEIKTYNSTM